MFIGDIVSTDCIAQKTRMLGTQVKFDIGRYQLKMCQNEKKKYFCLSRRILNFLITVV